MTLNGWLTIAEAAQRVGRSEVTIRRWVQREKLAMFAGRISEQSIVETAQRVATRKGGRPPKP